MQRALLALVGIISLALPARGDFLNDYFNDKVFGINPGPCPNAANSCDLNLDTATFPPSIANVRFCLFSISFGFFGDLDLFCDELKDWVQDGDIEVFNLRCENLGVNNIALTEVSENANTVINRIDVDRLQVDCTGRMNIINLRLGSGRGTVVNGQTDFDTDPNSRGIDLNFNLVLTAAGGFNDNLVDRAEINSCDFDVDVGLSASNVNGLSLNPFGFGVLSVNFLEDQILSLVFLIVEALIGGILCQVAEQAGTLENDEDGILNVVLNDLNDRYDELIEPVSITIDQDDADFSANPASFGSTNEEVGLALNLGDSNSLEFISATLNDFLGDPAVQPLRINQAINLITDPDGTFEFDVSASDLSTEFPLSFADINIKLNKASVVGLNSISELLFLDNDFTGNGLDFTLKHSFGMDTFEFVFSIEAIFERGEWVTQSSCGGPTFSPTCTNDQESFTFDFGLTVDDINFEAATLTAFNFDEIQTIQIGQVFDVKLTDFVEASTKILNCLAPSVYAAIFTDLAMTVGTIRAPVIENLSGEGLDNLVTNSVNLFTTLSKNLLANDLPFLMRGPIRTEVNNFLRTEVSDVESLENCPDYIQIPQFNPYLNFSEAPISGIFPILNDILGDFSVNSDVDLNDFIQSTLSYYAENSEDFPLTPVRVNGNIVEGDYVTKTENIPIQNLTAFEDDLSFFRFNDISILNLNTINRFVSREADATFPHGFSVQVSFAEDSSEVLQITLGLEVVSTTLGSDEKFEFVISLEGVDFDFIVDELLVNSDNLLRLTLEQTTHIPCVQSVLDGFLADVGASSGTAKNILFDINFLRENTNSRLNEVLKELDQEFADSTTNLRFTRISNYLFEIAFQSSLEAAEGFDYSVTPEECSALSSDFGFLLQFFTGIGSFDQSFFRDECLLPIQPIQELAEFEAEKLENVNTKNFINFQENIFIELIAGFLDISTGNEVDDVGTINSVLLTLANSTGNFLADLFFLEDPENGENATVTFQLPLNSDNDLLELLGLEPFSFINDEGFVAEVQFLRIKEINKFLNKLKLFQTPSEFTTRHSLGFDEEQGLTVELILLLQVNATIVDLAPIDTPPIQEFITIEADFKGITVDLEIFSPLRGDRLIKRSVGHFLSVGEDQVIKPADTILPCLLESADPDLIEVREFAVDFDTITEPLVVAEDNQLVSKGVEGIIEQVTFHVLEFYAGAVSNICQNCIREFMNDELRTQIILAEEEGCPDNIIHETISEENELLNFSDSAVYREMQDFLEEVMYANDFELWNVLVKGITAERFFDTVPFSTGRLALSYKGEDYGELEINMTSFFIENLDTFTFFELFKPKYRDDPTFVDSDRFFLSLAFNHTGPTTYSIDTIITGYDFFVQSDVVTNDLELKIEFTEFSLAFEMLLQFNLNTFVNLQFDQIDTLQELPCLITPLEELDIINFDLAVDNIEVEITCAGVCDSPLIDEAPLVSSNTEELADIFQGAISFAVRYLESSPAEQLINVGLQNSEESCGTLVDGVQGFLVEGEEDQDVFFYLFYVCGAVLLVLGVLMVFQYPKHKRILQARLIEFDAKDEKEFDLAAEVDIFSNEMRALAWSPVIPIYIKIGLPILCAFNIIALTWAVVSQGALTVLLTFTIAGMEMVTIDLVPFTVISTVNDLWNSGGWYLSIMIVGFSFLWPVVKNAALMFLWYTQTTLIAPDARASWLEFLDTMGKWSFVDVFVVVMTLAALQTSISISTQEDLTFLNPNFFFTFVTMKPEIGIVMLSVVSATSLVANHIMAYFHRVTQAHYRKQYDEISGNTVTPKRALVKKKLVKYKFAGRSIESKKIKSLMICNLITGLLTIVGVFTPLVVFEMRGVVGILVAQLDPDQQLRTFSVFDLGTLLFEAAPEGFDEQIVIALFVFLYFAVAIIGPVLQIVVLHIILTSKFNYSNFSTMIYIVMLVSFWTALDVVLVGVGATLLQITNVTDFIVNFITNDICTNVQGVLATFVPDEDNDSCLQIVGSFGYGAGILAVGTVGQLLIHGFTMILATRMKQDWYYFAYVLNGHRKRESKPKKLTYLRDRVYKFFTKSAKRRIERSGSKDEPPPEIDQAPTLAANNPRFTPKNPELPSFSGSGTVVAPPIEDNRSVGTDVFQKMDQSQKSKRIQSPLPPDLDDFEV